MNVKLARNNNLKMINSAINTTQKLGIQYHWRREKLGQVTRIFKII